VSRGVARPGADPIAALWYVCARSPHRNRT